MTSAIAHLAYRWSRAGKERGIVDPCEERRVASRFGADVRRGVCRELAAGSRG